MSRKSDHLRICTEQDVEFSGTTTLFEDVRLVHEALAEVSFEDIRTETRFMGKTLKAPLLISAVTGGLKEAETLNRDLARAAQELGIGFCLGSQRPMLENERNIESYRVRPCAPDALILGNIGIQQAAASSSAEVERLVTSIGADGIAVHLNPAQELAQAEGDRSFPDGMKTLSALAKRMPGRVMVKETGCGISRSVALRLKKAGVKVVDTAGAGGTSWPRVENLRRGASERGWLDEWGIPTAASLLEVSGLGLQVVGSGGVRTGLDAAKCLVLGADVAGMALPVLRAYAAGGYAGALACLAKVVDELKTVMLLVGAKDVASLKRHAPLITGRLKEWQTRKR